jgi:hypothetical protein
MESHKCEESKTCRCYLLSDTPNEDCPIHGAGPWPPRCKICGKFINWNCRQLAGSSGIKSWKKAKVSRGLSLLSPLTWEVNEKIWMQISGKLDMINAMDRRNTAFKPPLQSWIIMSGFIVNDACLFNVSLNKIWQHNFQGSPFCVYFCP